MSGPARAAARRDLRIVEETRRQFAVAQACRIVGRKEASGLTLEQTRVHAFGREAARQHRAGPSHRFDQFGIPLARRAVVAAGRVDLGQFQHRGRVRRRSRILLDNDGEPVRARAVCSASVPAPALSNRPSISAASARSALCSSRRPSASSSCRDDAGSLPAAMYASPRRRCSSPSDDGGTSRSRCMSRRSLVIASSARPAAMSISACRASTQARSGGPIDGSTASAPSSSSVCDSRPGSPRRHASMTNRVSRTRRDASSRGSVFMRRTASSIRPTATSDSTSRETSPGSSTRPSFSAATKSSTTTRWFSARSAPGSRIAPAKARALAMRNLARCSSVAPAESTKPRTRSLSVATAFSHSCASTRTSASLSGMVGSTFGLDFIAVTTPAVSSAMDTNSSGIGHPARSDAFSPAGCAASGWEDGSPFDTYGLRARGQKLPDALGLIGRSCARPSLSWAVFARNHTRTGHLWPFRPRRPRAPGPPPWSARPGPAGSDGRDRPG